MSNRFVRSQASIDNIQRSKFRDLSHSYKSSMNVGELIPFYVQEVLPGDTFNLNTNFVGRLQTPVTATMDNLIFEYFYFFVPNRLVWSNWKFFMGESKSAWVDDTIYRIPHSTLGSIGKVDRKSFLDYLRVPPLNYTSTNKTPISVLPRRAYDLIWNEWFRDENLQDPLLTYESIDNPNAAELERLSKYSKLLKTNKKHDYFTSCSPAPQKGPSVYIPFGDLVLPVSAGIEPHDATAPGLSGPAIPSVINTTGSQPTQKGLLSFSAGGADSRLGGYYDSGVSSDINLTFNNLYAFGAQGAKGAPTINALRFAFQVQKIYEKDARSGSRYVELIRSHFGVISPDSRQQRPEYLGGGSEYVGIQQQVASTAGTDADNEITNILGDIGAFSYTSHSNHGFNHSFTEHGLIIGLATLRYHHTYSQGVPKYLTRLDRFDFYDPALAHLGEQPVMKYEIYQDTTGGTINDQVFGYNEAWADYRYTPSAVTANMRPDPGQLGNVWTYADLYSVVPSLSATWIAEDSAPVERTLSVSSSIADNFFFDIYLDIECIRPMPLYSIPGLIDHF